MAEQPPCVLRRHRVGLRRLRLTATRPKDRPPCAGRLFGNPLLASACPLPKLDRSTGRGVRVERRWSAMSLVLALLGAARAALRTHTDLALENLALRQQLALLRHRSKRPRFGRLDRAFWVWLSRRWAGWRKALHVVRPETVIRWHRQGFRAFWTWKSRRGRTGRPPVCSELAELVRTMALANPLWGAPRIHGELLKLGFDVSQPGERSSRTTSLTSSPSTSSSCRLRPSVSSTCSWSCCNIAARSCTST